jgi:hypothetical protein
MNARLGRISTALAVLGLLFGALDAYVAATMPPNPKFGALIQYLYYVVAALQVVPAFGLVFRRNMTTAWSTGKKSLWMIWIVLATPMLVIGGLFAAGHFIG